jgi:hypothetical protein
MPVTHPWVTAWLNVTNADGKRCGFYHSRILVSSDAPRLPAMPGSWDPTSPEYRAAYTAQCRRAVRECLDQFDAAVRLARQP